MAGNEPTWLRPATDFETVFCQLQEVAGLLVSTYGLTISTTQPLKDEQVQAALLHLFRLVPLPPLNMYSKRPGSHTALLQILVQ